MQMPPTPTRSYHFSWTGIGGLWSLQGFAHWTGPLPEMLGGVDVFLGGPGACAREVEDVVAVFAGPDRACGVNIVVAE